MRCFVIAGLAGIIACAAPLAAHAQVAGTYRAQGRCPGQVNPYVGLVTITGTGPVYRWSERIGSGQEFRGVLIVQGNTLSVGFIGDFRGVLQATRTRSGWDGVWSGADGDALCRETWVRN